MSVRDVKKRRSQARAARKRAKSKPGPRGPAVMTPEEFRRIADPIVSEVAKQLDLPEEDVADVMESMVDNGYIGLGAKGQLDILKPVPSSLL